MRIQMILWSVEDRETFLSDLKNLHNALWEQADFEKYERHCTMLRVFGDSRLLDKQDSTPISWRDVSYSIPHYNLTDLEPYAPSGSDEDFRPKSDDEITISRGG